jgi:hypothetical protein
MRLFAAILACVSAWGTPMSGVQGPYTSIGSDGVLRAGIGSYAQDGDSITSESEMRFFVPGNGSGYLSVAAFKDMDNTGAFSRSSSNASVSGIFVGNGTTRIPVVFGVDWSVLLRTSSSTIASSYPTFASSGIDLDITAYDSQGMQQQIVANPEPSTISLSLLGIGGALIARRRFQYH